MKILYILYSVVIQTNKRYEKVECNITVQTMKLLIVEPSPLPIGPKYSPEDPVFKYP